MMPNISHRLAKLFANFRQCVAFVKMKSQCFMLLCRQFPHHLLQPFSSEQRFNRGIVDWSRRPGNTGDALMALLERRLDNVITRLGFATSRPQARQMITHGHITVNGRKLPGKPFLSDAPS